MLMAETLSDADSDLGTPDFAAFPGDVLRLLFKHLGLKDLLNAASTCLSWNRCSSGAWRSRCLARWQHWRTSPASPAEGAADKDWRDTYVQRHKLDAHILQLLTTDACWRAKQSGTYSSIMAHGADALDVLAAAARSKALSGLYVGTAYRAHTALLLLQAQIAGERLRQLLSAGSGTRATPPGSAELSPEAVSTADAAGTAAGEQQLNPGVSRQEGPEDPVLEVALQLAQALHPLADMSAVRGIIQQLGDELIRRLDSAGAAPDSMQALKLLNALLLSPQAATPPPMARHTNTDRGRAIPANAENAMRNSPNVVLQGTSTNADTGAIGNGTGLSIPTAGDAFCSSGPSWSTVWGRDEELFGPDLSTFEVPCDGHSSVGLEGSACPDVYRKVDSSCIDSVLAQRGGLPITMAILHRAVGRRAGLDIELVNMPGHVINRVQVVPGSGGGSSSSSGAGTTVQSVFVDVFYGKVLDEAGLRALWEAMMPEEHPLLSERDRPTQLPSMTAAAVCTRMLRNLCGLQCTGSNPYLRREDSRQLPSKLLPCLLQLAPEKAFSDALAALTWQITVEADNGGPVELYLEQCQRRLGEKLGAYFLRHVRLEDIQAQLLDEQNQINVRSSEREVEHPIGTHVRFQQGEAGQHTGFVCGWSVSYQGDLVYDVLSAPVQQCVQVKLTPGQLQAVCDPFPAGPIPPWGSSCAELVEEACGLLQGGWCDPDFNECVERFNSRHGQQLVSLDSLDDVCRDLRSCSTGVGLFFEAVWFDAAQEQWCLVPNAYMRHRFPEG